MGGRGLDGQAGLGAPNDNVDGRVRGQGRVPGGRGIRGGARALQAEAMGLRLGGSLLAPWVWGS